MWYYVGNLFIRMDAVWKRDTIKETKEITELDWRNMDFDNKLHAKFMDSNWYLAQ